MTQTPSRSTMRLAILVTGFACATLGGAGQTLNGEWRTYGGDLASTRYSPLDQINAQNFSQLEVAFRFRTESLGPRPEFNYQTTPLMVDGVLYLTAGSRRAAVALDAATGEMLWMHSLNEGKRGEVAPRQLSGRGLAYWSDGKEARIIYVTPGYQMVALDARTGHRVPTFGENGIVDLKRDNDQQIDDLSGEIGLHAAPIIAKNTVVIGAAHIEGSAPRHYKAAIGNVRGYDVRTGKRLWIFHTVPRPGEFGHETWLEDSWANAGNTGVWAQMSVDEELDTVYMGVELPTGDYYGGHRPGNSLFGESIVALDLTTGQRKWHYQTVHHGIWDWDIPCAPILVDITVDGTPIKALAQPTKHGWLFVLDRVTGRPVWPIEERPVPAGDVPREWYSPTQPFVTRPPAYERQGVSIDDLIDFTPELRAEAVRLVSRYKIGPLFTPPVVSKWEGPLATLMLPSNTGGANWPGGSFDPETQIFYIFTNTAISAHGLVNDPKRSEMNFISGRAVDPNAKTGATDTRPPGASALNVQGLPLVKPPYGRITALDLNKGEMVWQIAHGDTPDLVKNHPALKGLTIPRTGRTGRIGTLVTRTLLIAGEGGFNTLANGERGAYLRAYDKTTGADIGAVPMPAPQTGSPMTYLVNGRQHIALAVGGAGVPAELLVFRAPLKN
ncbi:MAG TPA: pyrroloquinoline quinone-dependent dehydrogenase [Vicinamibacterales bacterium]|nr:pyrroloquinoline quinone-dependent dehydrogenase [Vicinamibacterales bacterium]